LSNKEAVFPATFAWGVATCAAQGEGGIDSSDWKIRERKGEAPPSGDGSGKLERYDQDFLRLSDLGVKHYRASLEWSRIEPQRGVYDREEIDRVRRFMEAADRRGIKLWVTLHHVTLPAWFARLGGFADNAAFMYWHRYVEFVAKELGKDAEYWIPIHEPAAYAAGAYLLGLYPPARQRMDKFMDALVSMSRAHGDAYRILKAYLPNSAKVGAANLIVPTYPLDPDSDPDVIAADFVDSMINRPALDAIKDGILRVPGRAVAEVPSAKGAADFFGIDYFMRFIVSKEPGDGADARFQALGGMEGTPGISTRRQGEPVTEHGSGACTEGLGDAIRRVHRGGLDMPCYITASGIATTDEELRSRYLIGCLAEVHRAIEQGLDVRGYFHWTDVDGYEWNKGFDAHYGLFGMDPASKERIQRPAAEVFGKAAKEFKIELETADD